MTKQRGVKSFSLALLLLSTPAVFAQHTDQLVSAIVQEANANSQLEQYAFELVDVIGPRLVGSPQMQQAHE